MTLLSKEIVDFITMPFLCCSINGSKICKSSIYDEDQTFALNVKRVVHLLRNKNIEKVDRIEFCCDIETDYSHFLAEVSRRL